MFKGIKETAMIKTEKKQNVYNRTWTMNGKVDKMCE